MHLQQASASFKPLPGYEKVEGAPRGVSWKMHEKLQGVPGEEALPIRAIPLKVSTCPRLLWGRQRLATWHPRARIGSDQGSRIAASEGPRPAPVTADGGNVDLCFESV